MTKDKVSDEQMAERMVQHLDEQAAEIDAATLSRLRQARETALAELEGKNNSAKNPVWWWSGGLATACAGIFAVYLYVSAQTVDSPALEQLFADTEILAESEELEFFEELDFYVWLEDQELAPSEA